MKWLKETVLKKGWLSQINDKSTLVDILKNMGQAIDEFKMHSDNDNNNNKKR
jgi:hypothetical protein